MRALMGLIKDRHGTYYAQKRVPKDLQEAVATVINNGKRRQVFLKRSLGTKVLKEANVRAKPVQMGFDQIFKRAADLVAAKKNAPKPVKRTSLNQAEIVRMTDFLFSDMLAFDEQARFHGRAGLIRAVEWIRRNEDPDFELPYPLESVPKFGITGERLEDTRQQNADALTTARDLLARGDIDAMKDQIEVLLVQFEIELDHESASYRELGMNVLGAYVRACEALTKRDAGEDVPTPKVLDTTVSSSSGTLKDAFEGWKKERERPPGTIHEYERAVEMFIQLHGDLPIVDLRRSHARMFREALQVVPRIRKGNLREATLPELREWGSKHPEATKVSPGTVNKQLGAVQAIAGWGHHNGLVPDEVSWADPFSEMRLEEEQSSRGPFNRSELQAIFDAPLFTKHERPEGAGGEAGVWLPLLALYGGARQAEYAGLRASDVQVDTETRTPLIYFVRDKKAGRRLKTDPSERVVPVHPSLVKMGFLDYVEARRTDGEKAWLFPAIAPDQKGALSNWSKWWGRYLRHDIGVADSDKVFHSFRHGFQDALRRATPDEELRDALAGRSSGKSVSRTYGAKAMLERWDVRALKSAIDKISYPGLDLSRVRPLGASRRIRGTSRTWE